MKYLVTMEMIGTIPTSPQEFVQFLEQRVIPDHEALTKLVAEKKILAGGAANGARTTIFIVDVASSEELDGLLLSLPLYTSEKVDVTPLVSFEHRIAGARQAVEHVKATLK